MEMRDRIKDYWNERASVYSEKPAATTDDIYLRELEISTIIHTLGQLHLPESGFILDVGCGDGYSTIRVAKEIPTFCLLGVDYSEHMINTALKRLAHEPEINDRVTFLVGDVMDLEQACSGALYDVVLVDRCLINLDSFDNQSHAIDQIARRTRQGGYYISIENFIEGHENMNIARHKVGLEEIPVRWHNLYFKEIDFMTSVGRFYEIITLKDFASSYYFATRIIYSKMCQMRGEEPDYNHDIHKLAVQLPMIGQFSPIKMTILRKKLM